MPYIRTVAPEDAEGPLKTLYGQAVARAGRVFQIVRLMSLNPEVLRASMGFYMATCTSPRCPLPRWVREAIAVVVSKANDCRY